MIPSILADGYAVVNSNTGHDTGAEPMAYAYQNEKSAVDFSYWAVHTTTMAAKSVVNAYYGRAHKYAYHYGCSTGGRQADNGRRKTTNDIVRPNLFMDVSP